MIHLPDADFAFQPAFLIFDPRRDVFVLAVIQDVHVDHAFRRVVRARNVKVAQRRAVADSIGVGEDKNIQRFIAALLRKFHQREVGGQFSKVGRNPTNGSWWMVQVQPTRTGAAPESHQRQLVDGSSPAYGGLSLSSVGFTLCRMQVAPFTILNWAYQLHYYLCFRTHRRRACFAEERSAETLACLAG